VIEQLLSSGFHPLSFEYEGNGELALRSSQHVSEPVKWKGLRKSYVKPSNPWLDTKGLFAQSFEKLILK